MAAGNESAVSEIKRLEREVRDLQLTLHAVVAAHGGTIRVPHKFMVDPPKTLRRYTDSGTRAEVFSVS